MISGAADVANCSAFTASVRKARHMCCCCLCSLMPLRYGKMLGAPTSDCTATEIFCRLRSGIVIAA